MPVTVATVPLWPVVKDKSPVMLVSDPGGPCGPCGPVGPVAPGAPVRSVTTKGPQEDSQLMSGDGYAGLN
jgi:hypothetical protein